MKPEIIIKDLAILVMFNNEFAVFNRSANMEGLNTIIFSIPVTAKIADQIEKSGIVEVIGFSSIDSSLYFRRKSFYETHLMCEVVADVLIKCTDVDAE